MTRTVAKRSADEWSHASSVKLVSAVEADRQDLTPLSEKDAERARLEEALRQSKFRNGALVSIVSDLVFVIKRNGVLLEFHAPKDHDFMLDAEGLVGKTIRELLPSQIAQQATFYLEKTLRTGEPQTFVCPYQLSGRLRDFQIRLAPSGADEVIISVRDVTDRNRLEKEIIEISSREQMRIGQDLHDGLGQHLTGVTFLARALENKLAALSMPEAGEAAEIRRLVFEALSQTRNLARGIFPVELESSGLVQALMDLATTVEKLFNISCRFEGDEGVVIQDRCVSNHLFRLTQEAINNAVKHGKARHVVIGLRRFADKTVLSIRDDGLGFPANGVKTNGLGLRIMHYRAQKIGGALEVQPAQDSGTIVSCTFPSSCKVQAY